MAKMRQQRREAMRDRPKFGDDAPAALRAMADAATARGEALRKLADASQPLYASLDQDQKRRAMILARPMGPMGGPAWVATAWAGVAGIAATTMTAGRAATTADQRP